MTKKDIFIMSLHQFSKKAQKIRKATAEAFSFFRRNVKVLVAIIRAQDLQVWRGVKRSICSAT